jgi:phage/plasmid-like protein (TIGR03299 family)
MFRNQLAARVHPRTPVITNSNGRQNVFGAIEIAPEHHNNLADALAASGLNWEVEKAPVFLKSGTQVPDASAIVRKDTGCVLGVVGTKYQPVQNCSAFGVFQQAFDAGLLTIELSGQLDGGAIVWVQARVVGDPMVICGEDTISPYVLLANSHDGSLALRAGFTAVRMFCMNQMAAATKEGSLISMKHTRNINLAGLQSGIAAGQRGLESVVQHARHLAARKVPGGNALNVFTRKAFGLDESEPSRLDAPIQELFESGVGSDYTPIRGSWWSAYQSLTEYLTHHRGREGDARVRSLWFGDSSKIVGKGFEVAVEMAG